PGTPLVSSLGLAGVVDDLEVATKVHEVVVGPERTVLADPAPMARGRADVVPFGTLAEPGEDNVRDIAAAADADHGTGRGGRLGLRVFQPLQGVLDEVLDVGPGEVDGDGQVVGVGFDGLEPEVALVEPEVALVVGMADRLAGKDAAVDIVVVLNAVLCHDSSSLSGLVSCWRTKHYTVCAGCATLTRSTPQGWAGARPCQRKHRPSTGTRTAHCTSTRTSCSPPRTGLPQRLRHAAQPPRTAPQGRP